MDTIRVDICYRPLRVGWAIRSGDIEAFRRAVRLSYAFWGGRFNPIVVVDREVEAEQLVNLFRVDMLWAIGDTDQVNAFAHKFPHLITPLFPEALFVEGFNNRRHAQLLDVHNVLVHSLDRPEWKAIKQRGVRLYTWRADDPLSDVLLVQLGDYPDPEESGPDYRALLMQASEATEHAITSDAAIPADVLSHPSIAYMSRHGLKRHYGLSGGRDTRGFFVGDASNVDDLVCHWNLRAADVALLFVDRSRFARFAEIIPAWEESTREMVARRQEWDRHIAVWSRDEHFEEAPTLFPDSQLVRCRVSDGLWNGLNAQVPMMSLGDASVLGVVGHEMGKPRVSFALAEKPFCSDVSFHSQHLIASISFVGGLYGDEQHTLQPPYLPELNEFYARTMHFDYSKLRVEPERIGLVIDATGHDSFLYALPVAEMMQRLFGMAGYEAQLSSAGLIVRQLVTRLGGTQGARVFKIPGVRRLLRTHGPAATFTKNAAIQLIASKDPDNPDATFSEHEDLFIEQRPRDTKLRPAAVFGYLVEKGLFRIGAELSCPNCRIRSWTALDALKQRVVCELCGAEHDATRQLVDGEWHYRRSGVLGVEKNALGAVPVALTLQQLGANLHGGLHGSMYSPSLRLDPKDGVNLAKCEVDFVWVIPRPQKTVVILGECKDMGPVSLEDFERDVENLRQVADRLPHRRFDTFVLLSKLAPFTIDEIQRAKTLNDEYRSRTILLTARELEPYHLYDRDKADIATRRHAGSPEDLAQATAEMYFKEQAPV